MEKLRDHMQHKGGCQGIERIGNGKRRGGQRVGAREEEMKRREEGAGSITILCAHL